MTFPQAKATEIALFGQNGLQWAKTTLNYLFNAKFCVLSGF